MLLPAIYMGLSFVVFNRLHIGYRIFHHVCIVPLCLYYLLGVFLKGPAVFSPRFLDSVIAYTWFSSLSGAYLFFCLMLLVAYIPFVVYKKIAGSAKRTS
ncbi:hypothetical protein SAMN05216210_1395 [Halopseudomonas salegens]|uniref:Uncharacterized protein n=2 Tax=Halopseudomonas salegens TaxID=1434072 RepID=A0A1H2F9N9_9GAMM|nr:hypothetical protein SAMN05216210_1395 [Halopseudomonas salegens]